MEAIEVLKTIRIANDKDALSILESWGRIRETKGKLIELRSAAKEKYTR